MSVRLYVGNLPKESVEREKLQALFADEGDTITTKVIKDRKTGKCRGFAFVTPKVTSDGDALQPDPRWANELAKLKEMLAAQATNP